MTILSTDIKYRKSVVQTDTSTNGGRMGNIQVISGVRHALFPRVTKSQRGAGVTRIGKNSGVMKIHQTSQGMGC